MLSVQVKTNVLRLYGSAPGRKLVELRDAPPTEHAYFAARWLSTRKRVSICIADAARISALSAWSLRTAVVGSVEDPVILALWRLCRPWFLESKDGQKQSCTHSACLHCLQRTLNMGSHEKRMYNRVETPPYSVKFVNLSANLVNTDCIFLGIRLITVNQQYILCFSLVHRRAD